LTGFDLLYGVLLICFSPLWLVRLAIDPTFRRNFLARWQPLQHLSGDGSASDPAPLWIHAASIGETRLALKLMTAWLQVNPLRRFLLTTNTLSSLAQLSAAPAIAITIAPFDFSALVRRFITRTRVQHLLLIETEIWPNTIRLMAERGRVTIVNGRLSEAYFGRYLRFRFLWRRTLGRIDRVLARDEESGRRFERLGVDRNRVEVLGNLKFEYPSSPPDADVSRARQAFAVTPSQFCFVAGSIQPEETDVIVEAWLQARREITGLRLFIVPRHPEKRDRFRRELTRHTQPFSFTSDSTAADYRTEADRIQVVD